MSEVTQIIKMSQAVVSPTNGGECYSVKLRVVDSVRPGDFAQATRALQACEQAGLNGIKLVTEALNFGCGYDLNQRELWSRFSMVESQKIGETYFSDAALFSYSIRDQSEFSSNLLRSSQKTQSLNLSVRPLELTGINGMDGRVVDMGVILKIEDSKTTLIATVDTLTSIG